jgi:type II secretory pathway predicted ATPase ExeA
MESSLSRGVDLHRGHRDGGGTGKSSSMRPAVIYLGNPAVGGRGLYAGIVSALGGIPRFQKAALIAQTADLLAAGDHERGRTVVLPRAVNNLAIESLVAAYAASNAIVDESSARAAVAEVTWSGCGVGTSW